MNKNVTAISLIGTGALLALTQFTGLSINVATWPLFVIIPGLLILGYSTSADHGKWVNAYGAMTLATGLILAYQSQFDHFESWAYAWTLVTPGAVGLGWLIHGKRFGNQEQASLGLKMMSAGAAMCFAGIFIFEIVLNISGKSTLQGSFDNYVLPVILVGAGVAVMVFRRNFSDE